MNPGFFRNDKMVDRFPSDISDPIATRIDSDYPDGNLQRYVSGPVHGVIIDDVALAWICDVAKNRLILWASYIRFTDEWELANTEYADGEDVFRHVRHLIDFIANELDNS